MADDILTPDEVAALQRWLAQPHVCLSQQEGRALCDALTAAWADRDALTTRLLGWQAHLRRVHRVACDFGLDPLPGDVEAD